MAKTIVPNSVGTQFPSYDGFPDGRRRSYPAPTAGENKLLTLNPANAGNPLYHYVNMSARYRGAFRLQADLGGYGMGTARYSYGAIGFNPNGGGLLVAGHNTEDIIAEYNIPTPLVRTLLSEIGQLPLATGKQIYADAIRGSGLAHANDHMLCGIYSNGTQMILNIFAMYENSGDSFDTPTCVYRNVNNLAGSVVDGWMSTNFKQAPTGPICRLPPEWQAALGGTHISGFSNSSGRASIQALSSGPSIYSFNADDVTANSQTIGNGQITFNRLMHHHLYGILAPSDNALYNWDGGATMGNTMWTHGSEMSAMAVIPGTKSVLCIGGSAGHNSGLDYGDPPWGGYKGHFPRDPTDVYPYYWLISMDDLAAVRAGTLAYNAVVPYEVGVFPAPFQPTPGTAPANYITGGTIDEEGGTLYLSIKEIDGTQGYGAPPIILDYDISGV